MFGKSAKRKKRAEQLRSLIEAEVRWSDDPIAFGPQLVIWRGVHRSDGNPENTFI